LFERNDPPAAAKDRQEMAKRCLDGVAAAMQQNQRQLPRWTVDFVIHPEAVDGRVSTPLECAGMHGSEITVLQNERD